MSTIGIGENEFNLTEVRSFLENDLSQNEISRLLMGINSQADTSNLVLSELRSALQDSLEAPLLNRAIMALKINAERV